MRDAPYSVARRRRIEGSGDLSHMAQIELPRRIEEYFAFAEAERQGDVRRFSITLSYLNRGRIDRIQWYWRVNAAQEAILGESGMAAKREQEIARFLNRIDVWLTQSHQRLYGDGPFPCIAPIAAESREAQPSASATPSNVTQGPWTDDKVANG